GARGGGGASAGPRHSAPIRSSSGSAPPVIRGMPPRTGKVARQAEHVRSSSPDSAPRKEGQTRIEASTSRNTDAKGSSRDAARLLWTALSIRDRRSGTSALRTATPARPYGGPSPGRSIGDS